MNSPKAPEKSQSQKDAEEAQAKLLQRQLSDLDKQQQQQAQEAQRRDSMMQSGRVGLQSLLSNGWSGFSRGADLGAG